MVREGKIGIYETTWVLSLFCCSKILLTFPSIAITIGASAGWIVALIASITGWLTFQIIILLLKRFPGQTIVEAGSIAAGPIIGFIVAGLYLIFFTITTSIVLREFAEAIKIMALPFTPLYVMLALFLGGAAFCVYLGMDVIARVTGIVAVATLIMIIVFIVLLIHGYNFSLLLPIMGTGYKQVILGGLVKSTNFSELLFAGLIVNSVGGWKQIQKAVNHAILISTIMGSISVIVVIMSLGIAVGNETTLPLFILVKEIYFGEFFQRIESFFLIFWVAIGLLYVAIGFYGVVIIFTRMCKFERYRPLIPIFLIIIFTISVIPHDFTKAIFIDNNIIRHYSWIISCLVPLIILIIAIIRKKRIVEKSIKGNCTNE